MMPLIGFVLIPIVLGLLMYIKPHSYTKAVTMFVQGIMLYMSIKYLFQLHHTNEIVELLSNHQLPVGMTLKLDVLSSVLVLLNNLLFFLMIVFNYHKAYMNKLFIFLFLSLQGMINGIFLANDFFNVYILIEVATVTVSILIMFKKDSQSMYDGMIYLMVNMTAMAFFLLGIGFIYKYFGVLDFDTVSQMIKTLDDPQPLMMPYALLLTGVSLKAALMPLFSWLPKAHGTASAPSIVSSILSGIFVKTGLYLFIRLQLFFDPVLDVSSYYLFMGFITAIAGFTFAIAQKDIKLILAYHTISQVGLIMIGLNISATSSFNGAMYHILNHGVFKSLLFIIAGLCIEIFKTRDITKMKGLWYHSKPISIGLIIAILSITGAPFLSGGYSKYLISKGYAGFGGTFIFQLLSLGTMISFIKFFKMIITKPDQAKNDAVSKNEVVVVCLMALLCILFGVFGDYYTALILKYDASYPLAKQLSKFGSYLVYYAIGYGLYKWIIEDRKWTVHLSGIELGFNSIGLSIVTFFAGTMAYLNWIY